MKLLTRREIIEMWQGQNEEILDSYCCPNCRDILGSIDDENYQCLNGGCSSYEFMITKDNESV